MVRVLVRIHTHTHISFFPLYIRLFATLTSIQTKTHTRRIHVNTIFRAKKRQLTWASTRSCANGNFSCGEQEKKSSATTLYFGSRDIQWLTHKGEKLSFCLSVCLSVHGDLRFQRRMGMRYEKEKVNRTRMRRLDKMSKSRTQCIINSVQLMCGERASDSEG